MLFQFSFLSSDHLPEYCSSLFIGWVGVSCFCGLVYPANDVIQYPHYKQKRTNNGFRSTNTQTCFSHQLSGQAVHAGVARMEEVKGRLSARQFWWPPSCLTVTRFSFPLLCLQPLHLNRRWNTHQRLNLHKKGTMEVILKVSHRLNQFLRYLLVHLWRKRTEFPRGFWHNL